jgi:2-polyprenyl-3-methyl-5-hydroxy-6-metoxy-1,4-benzoquinol methylase
VEHVNCPSCEDNETREWASESGFIAVKCCTCGLIYVNPRPREEDIAEANKIGVHQTQDGKSLDVAAHRKAQKVTYYARIIGEMFAAERARGAILKWLDVGAGYGEVIEAVGRALPNADVEGIEPMLPKVRAAQARGLRVSDRSIDETDSDYDLISLINVFSHVPNFREFGGMLAAKLKPGGILFLETGNLPDLESRDEFMDSLYLPDHLVFAAPRQMEAIAQSIGLVTHATRAEPIDSPLWCAKGMIKCLLRGKPRLALPWRSSFRTVFYRLHKPI